MMTLYSEMHLRSHLKLYFDHIENSTFVNLKQSDRDFDKGNCFGIVAKFDHTNIARMIMDILKNSLICSTVTREINLRFSSGNNPDKVYLVSMSNASIGSKIAPDVFQKLIDTVDSYMKSFALGWEEVTCQQPNREEKRVKLDDQKLEMIKFIKKGKLFGNEEYLLQEFCSRKRSWQLMRQINRTKSLGPLPSWEVKILTEDNQLSIVGQRKHIDELFEHIIDEFFLKFYLQPSKSLKEISANVIRVNLHLLRGKSLPDEVLNFILSRREAY